MIATIARKLTPHPALNWLSDRRLLRELAFGDEQGARVRLASFTGSTDLGRLIARQCASTVKRLTLELGGNAPLIVFDDAHLDNGVERAIAAKFLTSGEDCLAGQDCLAANRIYVQRSIYRAFVDAFAQRIAALKVGSELDERVDVDPLVHESAVSRARARIENAVQRGARMLVAETRPPGHLFVMPTLLVDVPDEATIMCEEAFAPVAAVAPFDTEAEVVRRTNDIRTRRLYLYVRWRPHVAYANRA